MSRIDTSTGTETRSAVARRRADGRDERTTKGLRASFSRGKCSKIDTRDGYTTLQMYEKTIELYDLHG